MNKVGLLSIDMTNTMKQIQNIPTSSQLQMGKSTLSMLYDFWLIYVYQNDLIRDQYIYPDQTINNLLSIQYENYGASEEGFLMSSFLRMLQSHLDFNEKLEMTDELQKNADDLRLLRSSYPIH